jgi:hypothetical protein
VELSVNFDLIDIDSSAYEPAAQRTRSAAQSLESAIEDLQSAAAGAAGSAGHGGGDAFADNYQTQANGVLAGAGTLVSALYGASARFTESGAAHTHYEAASAGHSTSLPAAAPSPIVMVPAVTSIHGGTGGVPKGWQMVEDWVTEAWPDADTGRLHSLASAWASFADAIETARAGQLADSTSELAGYQSPDLPGAQETISQLSDHLNTLASAARGIASDVREYANNVDDARHEVENELIELAATIAGGGILSAILTPITMGASDLIDAGIDAAELSATGWRISNTLREVVMIALRLCRSGVQFGWRMQEVAEDGSGIARVGAKALTMGAKGAVSGTLIWGPSASFAQYAMTGRVNVLQNEEAAAVGGGFGGALEGTIGSGASILAKNAAKTGEAAPSKALETDEMSPAANATDHEPSAPTAAGSVSGSERGSATGAHSSKDWKPNAIKVTGGALGKAASLAGGNFASLYISKKLSGTSMLIESAGDIAKDRLVVVWPEPTGAHVAG